MAVRGLSKLERREAIDGYLFIMPWLIGFVLWGGGPYACANRALPYGMGPVQPA